MNLKDPESMHVVIGKVLRYGVLISAAVTILGTIGLIASKGLSEFVQSYSAAIPHDGIPVSLSSLASGIVSFSPFSWIQLGVIFLIATPVSRVLISVFLFAAERDRTYVVITAVVLTLLMFSMLVTPFIPGFHA